MADLNPYQGSGQGGVRPVLVEQLRTIDKSRVCHDLGRATQEEMEQMDRALQVSLGMGA